ncbi:DUF493 family protein [Flavobacteriaceae bacterium]|jgi:putative lipoic acid-binding regulatory protein|nr:DUF493 domain-containing protein [Flavobacteriaceae bacterium]MDC1060607.1 DUF493 family protein [Flavobacteriaceae bacterium]
MLPKENPEEFYSRFHEQLQLSQEWPGKYLFKFIVRIGEVDEKVLTDLFLATDATFSRKESSKNTFVSLSVLVTMDSPSAIVAIYKQVKTIKGVITL